MLYNMNPDLHSEHQGSDVLLTDPQSGRHYLLDAVGSQMLNEYLLTNSIDAVVQAMGEVYDVSQDTVRHDLLELLEALCKHGLATKGSQPQRQS